MENFIQLTVSGVMCGMVYALIAMGIVLIYKASGIFNFAQGALVAIGSFFGYQLTMRVGLPLWLGIIATLAFAVLLGFLVERLTLRPLIGQPFFAAVMMTLALGLAIDGVIVTIWGGEVRLFPIFPTLPIKLGPIVLSQEYVWSAAIAVVIFIIFTIFFRYTRAGLSMRGVAEDHQVARSLGVRVTTVFSQTWIIATVVAAIGGILLGALNGVEFTMSVVALVAFPVVLLGGLTSVGGLLIAGPIIGLSESLGSFYLDPIIGGGSREVFPFILMLIILLIKPHGLFGLKRIERI